MTDGSPKRGAALFTVEESHNKPRMTGPRLTDLGTVPTADDRNRNHGKDGRFVAGNDAARERGARRALAAPLRAARKRLREATEGQRPTAADELLSAALAVYTSARAELGSSSMFVLGPTLSFAVESVLAGHYLNLAAKAGFETEQGAAFVALAHSCETQASRAMTAALAACKALGGSKRKRAKSVIELIEAAASKEAP